MRLIFTTFFVLLFFCFSDATAQSSGAKYGTVSGRVRDAMSGDTIPYTQVVVEGTNITTLVDESGKYVIDKAPMGFIRLRFINLGYKDLLSEPVQITMSQPRTINVMMEPDVEQIEQISVVGRVARRSESTPLSNYKLNIQQIEKSPGGSRDISKVVQNLPGVTATPLFRNDLLVRGGGPNENKFFLDRIEIPVINHFATQGSSGGNASIINSDFLSGATLYTSAYPASRGGALSSVLDMKMVDGNLEKTKTKFAIGASDVALSVNTPLGKNKKSSLIASYRISYLQFLFSLLKLPFLPTYQDAQIKFTHNFDKQNSLTILALGAFDYSRLNLKMKDIPPDRQYILDYVPENDQWNYVIGAVYTHYTGNGGIVNLIGSTNNLNNSIQKWNNNDPSQGKNLDYVSREVEGKLRLEYNQDLGRGYTFNGGIGVERGFYSNRTQQQIVVDDQAFTNRYNTSLYLTRYSLYGSLDKSFFRNKLRLMLSLRADGNDYARRMYNPFEHLSPSIAASYAITNKWSVNASAGLYYQEPEYTTMGYRDRAGELVNRNRLRYLQSDQYVAGVTFTPNAMSKLSVEGFYKGYDRYPISLVDSIAIGSKGSESFSLGAEPVASVGRGRAYGVEMMYRNENLWGNMVSLSYTFYYSEFRKMSSDFTPTGPFVPSNWDNRHLITAVIMRDFGRGWEVGLRWRFAGGGPYTPYNELLSSQIDAWNATYQPYPDYSLQNTLRNPSFHQLDLRIDKTFYFKRWTLAIYVDVQNLYNYTATGQDILMPERDGDGRYVVDPMNPGYYKMQKIRNELGGTIVPTFGLIIEI